MKSKEFEEIAKSTVVQIMNNIYNIELTTDELELVWFAHELGFKKCTLYAKKLGDYYSEITYNRDKNEIYVDVYLKQANVKIELD